jgi:hypothetical protein
VGDEQAHRAHEQPPIRGVADLAQRPIGGERRQQRLDLRLGEAALAEDGEILVAEREGAQAIEEEPERRERLVRLLVRQERPERAAADLLVGRVGAAAQERAGERGEVGEARRQPRAQVGDGRPRLGALRPTTSRSRGSRSGEGAGQWRGSMRMSEPARRRFEARDWKASSPMKSARPSFPSQSPGRPSSTPRSSTEPSKS